MTALPVSDPRGRFCTVATGPLFQGAANALHTAPSRVLVSLCTTSCKPVARMLSEGSSSLPSACGPARVYPRMLPHLLCNGDTSWIRQRRNSKPHSCRQVRRLGIRHKQRPATVRDITVAAWRYMSFCRWHCAHSGTRYGVRLVFYTALLFASASSKQLSPVKK